MSNKVDGLLESFLLSCFVSGLKPQIQHEVVSFQPTSLTKAMALAKVQEQKIQFGKVPPKLFSPYPPILPTPSTIQPSPTIPKPINTTHSQSLTSNSHVSPKPNIQKLSQSQIQAKMEKACVSTMMKSMFLVISVRL